MENEELIPDTLLWHLQAFTVVTGLPLYMTMKKAFPGIITEVPAELKYFEAFFLPSDPENPYLDRSEDAWLTGLFQVNVYWPIGEGIIKVSQVARRLKYHYRNKDLDRSGDGKCIVRITREPSLGPDISSGDRIQIPVSIYWDVYPS